ncbi:MAG: hypothetical protein N2A40_04790, partial [Desulfobulbaceae bacterium]
PASRGDGSKLTIISSLLQGMEQDADASDGGSGNEQERQALWQARLVLKIAEVLDQEEEELALQLATIDDQEIDLFRRLQGEMRESGDEDIAEEEDPFTELLELKQKMNQPRPGMIKNRLRAWSRLFLSGPMPNFRLWTTRRQEAADILLEQYERESGHSPIELLQIDLPARISQEGSDASGEVEQFRTGMQAQLQELAEALRELVTSEIKDDTDPVLLLLQGEAWKEAWNARLESSFPASHYGRTTLTLFLLAGMTFSDLIGKAQSATEVTPPIHHALVAVWAA